ncbi:MAG: SpaA isopeptide-forming pilin-related protein [Verrucomicrobia bacterium]|nr:SpaA isopeptide-forming pilin-related protein [Verrucomicrobiota bacterium]
MGNRVFLDDGSGGGHANNGIQDGTEPGIANVAVKLFAADSSGHPTGSALAATNTDASGYYFFDNLPPGNSVVVVDFGFAPATDFLTITNRVFVDNGAGGGGENNGVQDGVEAGVSNVVLMLFAADGFGQPTGSVLASQTNDASGSSLFNGVAPGSYVVVVDAANSAGLTTLVSSSTNATSGVTLPGAVTNGVAGAAVTVGSGTNGASVFGFAPTYSIGNRIYRDPDNDGQPDLDNLNEGGIGGVRLAVFAADGSGDPTGGALAVTTNDVEGFYRFDGLVAGTYVVVVDQAGSPALAGYSSVTRISHDNSGSGDKYNHGFFTPLAGGSVLPGGIASVPVTVGFGLQPQGEATASEEDGASGPAGDANDNLTIDFGFYPLHSIGNRVFLDNGAGGGTANNGIQDGAEPGIAGVTVKLFAADVSGNPAGPELASTNTDADGYYRLEGGLVESYMVVVDQANSAGLAGLVSSAGASTDLTVDGDRRDHGLDTPVTVGAVTNGIAASAVNLDQLPPLGEPDTNNVGAGAHSPNTDDADNLVVDFGFVPAASVAGSVLHDATSAGVDGVRIALQTTNGATLATATTGGGGNYQFTNLAPGSYVIAETHLPNWVNVTGSQLPVTLGVGENSTGNNFRDLPFVNVAPVMNPVSDIHRVADWSPQTISLTGISAGPSGGPTNETSQTVSITVSSDNPALLPGLAVSYTAPDNHGTLTLTPGNNTHVYGTATVTVVLHDNGGTANGGVNSSAYTFTFTEVAPLVITANDDLKAFGGTKIYGAGQTAFTATGLIPGETVGSVTITAGGGTDAGDAVGSYPLTPSAATGGTFNAANYSISYAPGTLRVVSAESGLELTSSLNPSGYREAVTFTATLPGTNATGTVVFAANGTAFSTNTVADGSAESAALTNLLRGVSVITAAYSGDGSYLAATNSLEQDVTNHPPSFAVIADQTVNELATMTVATSVTDADGGPMIYELLAAPAGAAIDEAGVITWTPTEAQGPSTNSFTVSVADDGSPAATDAKSFTVVVREVNVVPTLPVLPDVEMDEMTTLTVTNTAADSDVPANDMSYFLAVAPAGAAISQQGVITWTPTEAQGPSTNLFTTPYLYVSNSFTVVVREVNRAPVLTAVTNRVIDQFATLMVTNRATDADLPGNELTFGLVSAPAGMTLNPTSGVLTWSPAAGQYPSTNPVVVRVTDFNAAAATAQSLSATQAFTVTVTGRVDTNAPTVSIAAPANNFRSSNAVVTVRGTARDDWRVSRVLCRVGDGEFVEATGTTNWTTTVTLTPGVNTIAVKAVDLSGNESAVVSRKCSYVVYAPLTLRTNGVGKILWYQSGVNLEVNSSYTVAAYPGNNWLFSGWSGDIVSTNSKLSFVMRSNLVLQADFETNRFIGVVGTYNGLFADPAGVAFDSAGYFTVKTTAKLGFSGKLLVNGGTYSMSGSFDLAGLGHATVKRPGKPTLSFALQLDLDNTTDAVTGSVSDGTWTADLTGYRAATRGMTNLAGNYTMVIPGATNAALAPAGHGYGLVSVATNGAVKLAGALGDGIALKQATGISEGGHWPLFVQVYPGTYSYYTPFVWRTGSEYKGLLIGWARFEANPGRDLSGTVIHLKTPDVGSGFYPAGFYHETPLRASAYTAPAAGALAAELNPAAVFLTDGNLPGALTNHASLNTNGSFVVVAPNDDRLALSVAPKNGFLTGQFLYPGTTSRWGRLKGVVLQDEFLGAGFFLGTNQSGALWVQP